MSHETEAKQEMDFNIIITDIKIVPFKCASVNHILALANIVLNDCILIRGLRVMEGTNKPFVSYPVDPFLHSVIVPLTRKLNEYIEDTVIKQYQKEFTNG